MATPSTDKIYQLSIRLADIEPPIWRRIVISGQVTLFDLHRILQVVMGWKNYHLHQFIVGTTYYGEPDSEDENEMKDERCVRLRDIARRKRARFLYEYDFGDGWQHVITVENIQPWTQESLTPRCLDGARACPPEDSGGVGRYEYLLEVLRNPHHPEYKEMSAWVGKHFNPERFSLQAINSAIAILQ